MSSGIIGRKVDKEVLFNIDGQPIQDDAKTLKFAAIPQPQLVNNKPKQKVPSKPETHSKQQNNLKTTQNNKRKTNTKNSQKQVQSSPKKQTPSHTVFQNITNQQKSPANHSSSSPSPKAKYSPKNQSVNYREPRYFKPLSEQFPNLVGPLFEEKKFTEDVDDSHTDGSESYLSEREQGDDEVRKAPQPEVNPQVSRNVNKIVQENNKKYVYSKKEEAERQEMIRKSKLQQREQMKKYGKQQIVRAHTQRENFEQKFAWGVNQKKLQEDKEKFQKLVQDKEQERQQKAELEEMDIEKPNQIEIAKLFPESQGRESRYKKMWQEEAKKAVDKKQFSMHKRDKTLSPERCKSGNSGKFRQDFEENAKKILKNMKNQQKEKDQEKLMKKHKVEYIEREVKAIFSSMKKKKWVPKQEFNNKAGLSTNQSWVNKQKDDNFGVQDLFEQAENEAEDFSDQARVNHYQQKVINGKVLSQREVREFKEDQDKKKQKVDKFKKDLKNKKNITLKNPEPLTQKELNIKKELDKEIDIKGQVEKQIKQQSTKQPRQQQQAPKTTIQQPDLGEFIFAEAELPQYHGEYEEEQRMGFREQVEQEIKEQILMQKQKRPAVREVMKEKQTKQEYARKPQEREGPKYRKEQKFKSQPRYPVYHDLGEVQLLEDDMYNAQHSKWTPYIGKLIDNSSDDEDEKEFLDKTTVQLRSNLKKGKENTASQKTYSKSVQGKKSVYFREPESKKADIGNEYLTDQKEKLMRIVENQKARGQATSDDDSDIDLCQAYSSQIWLATDPMKRDVFIMSSKELMELPNIQL